MKDNIIEADKDTTGNGVQQNESICNRALDADGV